MYAAIFDRDRLREEHGDQKQIDKLNVKIMDLNQRIVALAGKVWDTRTYQEYRDGWDGLSQELARRHAAISFDHADPGYLRAVHEEMDYMRASRHYKDYIGSTKEAERQKALQAQAILITTPAYNADLDARDGIEYINRVFPPAMLAQLPAQDQQEIMIDLVNIPNEEVGDIIADANETLAQSLNDFFPNWSNERPRQLAPRDTPIASPEPQPIRKRLQVLEDLENRPGPSRTDTSRPPSGKVPKYVTADMPKFPPGKSPPLAEEPQEVFFRKKVKNSNWMNTLFIKMRDMDILRFDEIKRANGQWSEVDVDRLIRRMTSNSHAKLKTPEPKGYKTALMYLEQFPTLLRYVGDHIRRDFTLTHKHFKLPEKLELADPPKPKAKPNTK